MKNKKKTSFAEMSWIITAFIVCIIPYFGIFVFLARALYERKMHISDSDYMLGPAVGMLFWGSSCCILFSLIFEFGTEMLLATGIFLLPVICGIILLIIRKRFRAFDNKLRLCVTVIARGHLTDLEKIAECLSLSVKETADCIEYVIAKGRLARCSLNEERTAVIIDAPWSNAHYQCKICGAEQRITIGLDLVCKYCGNPIE